MFRYQRVAYVIAGTLGGFRPDAGAHRAVRARRPDRDCDDTQTKAWPWLKIRTVIWQCLAKLKQEGQAILVVDKHLNALLPIADRHVVIEKGHVVWTGSSQALAADATIRQRYLQV